MRGPDARRLLLEQFSYCCSETIARVPDVLGTFRRRDGGERWPHGRPQVGQRTRGDRPQVRFEFRKDLFDRIEVRAVGGQIAHLGARRLDRLAHPGHFMAGEIVQDDAVARAEGGSENLFDIGHEAGAIERPVEDGGGGELVGAERRKERRRVPMSMGDFGDEAGPAPTAAIAPRHLCLERGLVQEDEPGAVPLRGLGAPLLAGRLDIRPVLFGGV